MPKTFARLLLVVGSTGVAALALLAYWHTSHPSSGVEFRRLFGKKGVPFDAPSAFEVADSDCCFRHESGLDQPHAWGEHPRGVWHLRTNSLGLREDRELSAAHPDLRILVTGDSHTDGVCDNAESFPHLLEARLAAAFPGRTIESINAGKGRYTFDNYLGVLDRFRALAPDAFVVTVYGGNDFEEGLNFYHRDHKTKRPPGSAGYWPLIAHAMELDDSGLAQAFASLKYFAAQPGERETALTMACDVSDRIIERCKANGVRPIFVYLPPPTDVQWSWYRTRFEAMQQALELSAEELGSVDAIADRWLAHLRERGVETLDLREEVSSYDRALYWNGDLHIDLEAQRLIARELEAFFNEHPSDALDGFERRAARDDAAPPAREVWSPTPSGEPLRRRSLSDAEVARLFAPLPSDVRDPSAILLHAPNTFRLLGSADDARGTWSLRTNSFGLRSDSEPAAEAPDLRLLLLGDEHVEGACDVSQSAASALEASLRARHPALSVEVLDAAKDGYGPHNELGAFEHYLALRPRGVVLVLNGGNDFLQALDLRRTMAKSEGLEPAELGFDPRAEAAQREFLASSVHFAKHPRATPQAVLAVLEVIAELQRQCRAQKIELLVVYLPPAVDAEWELLQRDFEPVREALQLGLEDIRIARTLARSFVAGARELGLDVLDLEPALRTERGPHFSRADYRLAPSGQQLLARELLPRIERTFALDGR